MPRLVCSFVVCMQKSQDFTYRGPLIKILSKVMLESFDVFILTLGSVTNVRTALSDILSAGMHTH